MRPSSRRTRPRRAGTGASGGTVANTYRPGQQRVQPGQQLRERRHLICMRVCTSASCTKVSHGSARGGPRVVRRQLVGHVLADVQRGAQGQPHVVQRRQPGVGLLRRQLDLAAVRGQRGQHRRRGRVLGLDQRRLVQLAQAGGQIRVLGGEVGQQPGQHPVLRAGGRTVRYGTGRSSAGCHRRGAASAALGEQVARTCLLRLHRRGQLRFRPRSGRFQPSSRVCIVAQRPPRAAGARRLVLSLSKLRHAAGPLCTSSIKRWPWARIAEQLLQHVGT